MSAIKKLAGQTAIYGLSSILGRFLNYLLVPLHTKAFETAQYGIISELYAYVSLLIVLLTYGMETAFFRFFSKYPEKKGKVFGTALISVSVSSIIFILICLINQQAIANTLGYPNHAEYVVWFSIIVGFDAISSIPLARLRSENRAKDFAIVSLSNIAINIGLNLIFILGFYNQYDQDGIGIGYVFIANLIASIVKLGLLVPKVRDIKLEFDWTIWKNMLSYAWPILFFGLAGIVNETMDRIMLPDILFDKFVEDGHDVTTAREMAQSENGIYGAVYKISILITLFVQAFRYAAEPFFFNEEKENPNAKKVYSKVMNVFVAIMSLLFLGIMLYLDIIKYFIDEKFWAGLSIVPILLLANIFMGIYFNQSIWYKLNNKTIWGLYLALIGVGFTLLINLLFIPSYSYEACAWATFFAYLSMMTASYYFGQKHYPIKYNLRKVIFYIALSVGLYFLSLLVNTGMIGLDYLLKTVIFAFYLFIIWGIERPHLYFKK